MFFLLLTQMLVRIHITYRRFRSSTAVEEGLPLLLMPLVLPAAHPAIVSRQANFPRAGNFLRQQEALEDLFLDEEFTTPSANLTYIHIHISIHISIPAVKPLILKTSLLLTPKAISF